MESILIVEDDEALNEVLAYNLSRAGYRVTSLFDGTSALEELAKACPDLLLLDLMLPGASGLKVCEFVTASKALKELPIIIFTAKSAREDFDEARKFDVAGYFVKPYATNDVLRHVEKVLKNRRATSP